MKTLILILLSAVLLACILLDKARRTLGIKELRRRARGGKDTGIYKLAAHGESQTLFLWLVGSVCGAVLFVELAEISVWLAGAAIILASWLALSGRTLKTEGLFWKIAGSLSVPTYKIVGFLQPVLARVSKFTISQTRGGLSDKEDLIELLQNKIVREVMTPRGKIKFVPATDSIGPLLMNELHSSGLRDFPVVQSSANKDNHNVIGTLNLDDLLNYGGKGHVRDVMKRQVFTISETQTLRQALNACLKNHQSFLLVANNFEEIAGMISLEDILGQILGGKTPTDQPLFSPKSKNEP